ncbi:MAG TPA: efflux RND transporter periplasmic adaptor subunit [Tepidisphaeraceae bacterium]|jgi:multidrug resistance efflux pump
MALAAMAIAVDAADPSSAAQPDPAVVTAHTEPSKILSMNFYAPGVIKSVAVKEGDVVKAGQVLMSQDNDIEKEELARLKIEADSTARLEYAQADLDVKTKVYQRKSKAEGGVFSQEEIEEAQLDQVHSAKQIDVVKLDDSDNLSKEKQQELKVSKMDLRSPIDGVVQEIKTWEGVMASPDPEKPVITVVRNNPCYVVIPLLKTWQVAQLSLGQTMPVKYQSDADWSQAKIIYISPVAKAESDTQLIKLELPNPQNRATGLPIQVKIPANIVDNGLDKTALR